MPEVRLNIQNIIEASVSPTPSVPDFLPDDDDGDTSFEGEDSNDEPLSSPLLSEESKTLLDLVGNRLRTFQESSIGQGSVTEESTFVPSPLMITSSHIGSSQVNSSHVSSAKIGTSQIGSDQLSTFKGRATQIGVTETNFSQISKSEIASNKFSSAEGTGTHIIGTEVSPTEVSFGKVDSSNNLSDRIILFPTSSPAQVGINKFNSEEVSLSNSIASEELISSNFHNSTPQIINALNNSATNIWADLLQSETQLDIDFQIADLPKGQLAEATITGFEDSGVPNAGRILIDRDANGVGWFIDETPLNNSEFTAQDTDSYLLATAESEADGKYDLLTTVLHELSHLYGFIDGYEGFEDSLETENGTTKFIGNDFEATLDSEHLDKSAHPYDLLNTHLAPGMRKLPSDLDVEILQALIATELEKNGSKPAGDELLASLTSDPLLAIANGDFEIDDTTTDSFAWDTRGASGIEEGQAVLTEDSPFLSNFTQTFTVPEEAKTVTLRAIALSAQTALPMSFKTRTGNYQNPLALALKLRMSL